MAKVTVDSALERVLKTRSKKSGHIYKTEEHKDHTYVLPLPDELLALMWLVGGINGIPLGRVLGVSGPYGSFKSTFLAYLGNLFLQNDGIDLNIDTEQKTSATMYQAIRHSVPEEQRVRGLHEQAGSVEDWQEITTTFIKDWGGDDFRKLGPGQRIPLRIGIDSIIGKEGEDEQKSIMKEGHAEARGYAVINNQIKKFFAGVDMSGLPVLLSYVTHIKDVTGGGGGGPFSKPEQKELGGTSPSFYATIMLRFEVGRKIRFQDPDDEMVWEGYMVNIGCHKTSAGAKGRRIQVPYIWTYLDDEEDPSGFRQISKFDWHWALGFIVWQYLCADNFVLAATRDKWKEHFHVLSGSKGSFSSPDWGETKESISEGTSLFGEEGAPVCGAISTGGLGKMRAVGKAICDDPEKQEAVRKLMHIAKYPSFQEVDQINFTAGK